MHRIRSGAILTASQRNLGTDTPRNPSQRDFGSQRTSSDSYGSATGQTRPSTRRPPISRAPLSAHDEQPRDIDLEKGLHHGQQSVEEAGSSSPDTQTQVETAATVNDNNNGQSPPKPKLPFGQRMRRGTRRFWMHTRNALTHSWLNVLLIFVPIGIAAEAAHLNPAIVFAMNAVAIIPLAGLLTMATESVASRLGDTWGALLNVSFGNAVEFIIFIIGLAKNEIRIVQAALLGSLLANLLLILGMAFALGGLRYREQIYNSTVTQMSACLLSLSVMSLLLPTAFHASFEDDRQADKATIKMSRGVSVILLFVYLFYLLFQLKSHSYMYQSVPQERIDQETEPAFLHDMLDPESSTSSSSSSSDSDSDTTHNTRRRIKRAFTSRKRRKSSAATSNKDHVQDSRSATLEHLPLDSGAIKRESNKSEMNRTETSKSEDDATILETNVECPPEQAEFIDAQIEHDDITRPTTVRDFQYTPAAESPPASQAAPEPQNTRPRISKHASRRSRRNERRERRRRHRRHHEDAVLSDEELATVHQVGFAQQPGLQQEEPSSARRPGPTNRLSFFRPPLPKLFSENVFVQPPRSSEISRLPSQQPQPSTAASLRRARSNVQRVSSQKDMRAGIFAPNNNSSPNLSRAEQPRKELKEISTIPGRGLQPSMLPKPPRRRPTEQKSEGAADEEDDDIENAEMSRIAAVVLLLASTGLVALCAEFLVDAIPAMTANSSVSQAFIGLIILPIVGNAAEHATAVTVALKNKMDLAIGVALGSSIQISLFITPLVIIIGWIMNKDMTLYFTLFETISLFATAFVVNFLVLDGRSNYLEGTLLMAAYIIIAIAAFYYPDTADASELGGTPRNHTSTDVNHMRQLMFR